MADPASAHRQAVVELLAPLRVEPGTRVSLAAMDPEAHVGVESKSHAEAILRWSVELLADHQARLAAQNAYGLLVVLQGMDASGKDGTISHVMSGVNPQGVEVHPFKVPSADELDHDYLWRYAQALPARGKIAIFNRSHYEEVGVVRVHPELLVRQHLPAEAVDDGVWRRRFEQINHWEHYLVDNGIRVVKLFLHVSEEQQRRRLLRRIDDPIKRWKFSVGDVDERQHWDEYQAAYEDALSHTSTEWAPWHIVPADRKWFAHLVAAAVIVDELARIGPTYPELGPEDLRAMEGARRRLEAEAPLP